MYSEEIRPYKEERPWGNFIQFSKNQTSTVKIITVNPNQTLSLQSHKNRSEFWRVLDGDGMVTIDEKIMPATQGAEFFIPKNTKHRISAKENGVRFLEIALGDFDENDIERFADEYGRA